MSRFDYDVSILIFHSLYFYLETALTTIVLAYLAHNAQCEPGGIIAKGYGAKLSFKVTSP